MDEALAYFLALRVHVRRSPEARAVVDRCLLLLVRARTASPETLLELEADVDALRADLVRRFGEPKPVVMH